MNILQMEQQLGHSVGGTCYHLLMEFLNIIVLESKKGMTLTYLLRKLRSFLVMFL